MLLYVYCCYCYCHFNLSGPRGANAWTTTPIGARRKSALTAINYDGKWGEHSLQTGPGRHRRSKSKCGLGDVMDHTRNREKLSSILFLEASSSMEPDIIAIDYDRNSKEIDGQILPLSPVSSTALPYITPYQILHPILFPLYPSSTSSFPMEYSDTNTTTDRSPRTSNTEGSRKSIYSVLRLFQDCLNKIQEKSSIHHVLDHAATVSNNGRRTIRIEHLLAGQVDALAWLRAQVPNINNNNIPLVYFMAQEKDTEVAVIGSSWTLRQEPTTNTTSQIPFHSTWYGASRFDSSSATNIAPEWQRFGAAVWMLPAIELLIRKTPSSSATTLAMHLVIDDEECGNWSLAASRLSSLLTRLSSQCAAATPSTTLPPIVSRDDDNNDDEDEKSFFPLSKKPFLRRDPQELYEQAVLKALQNLSLSSNLTKEHKVIPSSSLFSSSSPLQTGPTTTIGTFNANSSVSPQSMANGSVSCDSSSQRQLEKVVLARRQNWRLGAGFNALDVLSRWKYGGHEGGHLFYLRPPVLEGPETAQQRQKLQEFFGCTPERLFRVQKDCDSLSTEQRPSLLVTSEALAGTRPRGATLKEDESLLRDLLTSPKDFLENRLTGSFIEKVFDEMHSWGWVSNWNENNNDSSMDMSDNSSVQEKFRAESESVAAALSRKIFVRRLLHVQHICQRYTAKILLPDVDAMNVTRHLLRSLHPTPAICGVPQSKAQDFIRQHESISFDRGFYSGPFGYIGSRGSDIVVAIRSGLATTARGGSTTLSGYAGSGLVAGSTLEGEWAETNYKFAVLSSLFPQSPLSLRGASTPNVAWATAFVAELIRNGITRFYICPGSRSTPFVAAIAKAVRSNVGVVHAVSVHDERAAGFRAVGYARGFGKPAVVLTSSGTSVANLYPSVVESGMDGVPLLLLTADRPYESRATGSNQAVDQVKTFSETYIRWFRDILPPSDDVPVSLALSDAAHGVYLARQLRGPVHLNVQFRENLAPNAGPIRSDYRIGSVTRFNGVRFTDVPGFDRWSKSGGKWSTTYVASNMQGSQEAIRDIANLIAHSKRGIIVVGNLRPSTAEGVRGDQSSIVQVVADFARAVGLPVFAGVQCASLRFSCSAVVPFAEHILKCPIVAENLQPDLVLQIGAPLVSTSLSNVIADACKNGKRQAFHCLLHPHVPQERADPLFTVTHVVSADIAFFLNAVTDFLRSSGDLARCSSELAPIVQLGRMLQSTMRNIILESSDISSSDDILLPTLTEPQIILALTDSFEKRKDRRSLFLSNSMPIRDAEFFLYPTIGVLLDDANDRLTAVGTNRGASGIDGVISSALGFCESTETRTTLVIGDLATLHDVGSLHSVTDSSFDRIHSHGKKREPLTTIVVNNNGGGIFSFLPIADHGKDVSFEEFFGTPTKSFSFEKGAEAFGLSSTVANSFESFVTKYDAALDQNTDFFIEARVVDRTTNVNIHKKISQTVESFISNLLVRKQYTEFPERLPVKVFRDSGKAAAATDASRTLVLLHGWMGDKHDWDDVVLHLRRQLGTDWSILSVDLPGHGGAPLHTASSMQTLRSMLRLKTDSRVDESFAIYSVDHMAESVLNTLAAHYSVERIDALAGYSAGGRVALAMKRLCASSQKRELVTDETRMVLLGANPGDLKIDVATPSSRTLEYCTRSERDKLLSNEITSFCDKVSLSSSLFDSLPFMEGFLERWYSSPMWGDLLRQETRYRTMIEKRSRHLLFRGRDLALALTQLSPACNNQDDWRFCSQDRTLFLSGELDAKYTKIGKQMQKSFLCQHFEIHDSGHALLVESPLNVARRMAWFLTLLDCSDSLSTECKFDNLGASENILLQQTDEDAPIVAPDVPAPLWATTADAIDTIDAVEFQSFSIDLVNNEDPVDRVVSGIGWGSSSRASASTVFSKREGFIVQLVCTNGLEVGLGEISPLPGVHTETVEEAKLEIEMLQIALNGAEMDVLPEFEAENILGLNGALDNLLTRLSRLATGRQRFLPSVGFGLEMALISLAAQKVSFPVHQALSIKSSQGGVIAKIPSLLSLNGLITRRASNRQSGTQPVSEMRSFPSYKVKVGHQDLKLDMSTMLIGFQLIELYHGRLEGRLRADANRAWNEGQAIEFATALESLDVHALEKIEFIEEPIQKVLNDSGEWSLEQQVNALERSFFSTSIPYALDESLVDLAKVHTWKFDPIQDALETAFKNNTRGCAAMVLKPALLGLELSMRLAKLARTKLGIGAVFSSTFDSGLGLAHTAFLGYISDQLPIIMTPKTYPHGLGTFAMLRTDTLTPSFGSYVDAEGSLNIPSLSRALYGLSLDEVREATNSGAFVSFSGDVPSKTSTDIRRTSSDNERRSGIVFEGATATSGSGKEISVVVSLPLPFSAETASARFTDLPSMSRWSPWISSVLYKGAEETEWTINVRGIPLTWRATSEILDEPYPGIRWQSVSGLNNRGVVEFVANDNGVSTSMKKEPSATCLMNVRMTVVTPRILRPLFQGTSLFLEEFLRDKLLKWSLEMFRDVVKADLALER